MIPGSYQESNKVSAIIREREEYMCVQMCVNDNVQSATS